MTRGKGKEKESSSSSVWEGLGSGNTLGNNIPRELGEVGAGGARVPRLPQRNKSTPQPVKERSPSPDWGVDDSDDDAIIIDSD